MRRGEQNLSYTLPQRRCKLVPADPVVSISPAELERILSSTGLVGTLPSWSQLCIILHLGPRASSARQMQQTERQRQAGGRFANSSRDRRCHAVWVWDGTQLPPNLQVLGSDFNGK